MSTEPYPPFLATLVESGDYSDLTLVCEGQQIKVHRSIVCAQSPVIAAALRHDFKEAQTNIVEINFDIESCKRMVKYMYTGNYDTKSEERPVNLLEESATEQVVTSTSSDPTVDASGDIEKSEPDNILESLLPHVRMNIIADYYQIQPLARMAIANVQQDLQQNWSPSLFTDVLKSAVDNTGDASFFTMAASVAAEHLDDLDDVVADLEELELPSVFITAFMREASKKSRSKTQRLLKVEHTAQNLETNLISMEAICESQKVRVEEIIKNVNACHTILGTVSGCRNSGCNAQFTCYIESKGYDMPKYSLRCERCKYRHEYSA